MAHQPVHPIPTQRTVLITALDKRVIKLPLEQILKDRGFDLRLPYRQEPVEEGATYELYVQDIPQESP